ncbi:MAG: acetyl-CoA carboxylase biotin carboxyl carrier protein [Calditrichaeota bacterium]|nr:acetyl-CoA carboxylase biotin carboxyl carrier protein [Calditrichota bacterium]MCB9366469.1 acetyl-CoA carboxylase biotin carboxyl carrier protein [Calditrichota bacterium]MCB9391273.1 acetyl-CoA carboxylase biotin carboxyl carrier protein [Calditrichota bacterium]
MATRPPKEKSRLDLAEIQKLVRMLERSPITEFELVESDLRIRISKNGGYAPTMLAPAGLPGVPMAVAQVPTPGAPSAAPEAAPKPAAASNLIDVKAPMVGTFYRAPSPDADVYVRVGDSVEPGKVLCIIEAMKLMNEIESEFKGRIAEILIENAQPVEYGQVLFRIERTA